MKSKLLKDAPQVRWGSPDIGCQAIVDWLVEHYRRSEKSRLCFAIQGASAVGKTTLAYQVRQKLIEDIHITTWLVRRDVFLIKEPEVRLFDREATIMMQGQLHNWRLHNKKADKLLGCPVHLPQTLHGNGIVLLDDMRNMPDMALDGSIYLFHDPSVLTRREEERNQKSWPRWEHLRRQCSKLLLQRQLLRQAVRSGTPCLIVCWNPHGQSTAKRLHD